VVIGIGQRVTVRLTEASPLTGGLILELLELDGAPMAQGPKGKRGRPMRRRPGSFKAKAKAAAKKAKRRG
jgi:ribonuclease R